MVKVNIQTNKEYHNNVKVVQRSFFLVPELKNKTINNNYN